MEQDPATKYTVIPIENPDHQAKLFKYLEEFKDMQKTSFCRFFLRGLCIMKSQCCKFAHNFDQLKMNEIQYKQLHLMECSISDKEDRKRMFLDKTDFHQRPLFFVRQLDYYWLYHYQFTERYKKSNIEPVSQKQINKNQPLRHRIREILHREQWDKLINFIQETFPEGNYTIDMFSNWFAMLGFEKSQTFCKFGDFMRYLTCVKGYTQVNIIVPPRSSRSIFYLKNKTYLYEIQDSLIEESNEYRNAVKKMKEDRLKKMPQDIKKKFICRFYMAGNCTETQETCFYVHNIEDMNYDPEQQFLVQYRQPPKSKEDKMNYVSLFRYYNDHKKPEDPELTMDDVNSKFGHKQQIRRKVHHQVYRAFLDRLRKQYKIEVMPLKWVKEEHTKFGFNHTDQNKFGQLQSSLWELGYYNLDIKDQLKQKVSCIAKVPEIQYMDSYFKNILLKILKEEVDDTTMNEKSQILQSSLRRLVYSTTEGNQTEAPLHVYLRKKRKNFKQVLQELTPQYIDYIFFESTEENYKKLMDLVKKYLKKHKKMIHSIQEIDSFVRGLSINEINMNKFANYRNLLEFGLLQMGKEIYFWPFVGQALVIDRSLFKSQPKQPQKQTIKSIPIKEEDLEIYSQYREQKILVVDNMEKFKYCSLILRSCFKYGVDLQGKLSQKGYVDFIQISCINQRKYIFVIDIWKTQKYQPDLYQLIRKEIKQLFEDQQRIKIFHACQQDVVALVHCMEILPKPIFDTSAMDIYLQQRNIYQKMYHHNMTYEHTLKKLHHIKTPGLNQILETWKAPNGPNQLKEKMKKVFQEGNRAYFQTRPIIDEFLQYSARDVQDLIEVHEEMLKEDKHGIWLEVGRLYSHFGV